MKICKSALNATIEEYVKGCPELERLWRGQLSQNITQLIQAYSERLPDLTCMKQMLEDYDTIDSREFDKRWGNLEAIEIIYRLKHLLDKMED